MLITIFVIVLFLCYYSSLFLSYHRQLSAADDDALTASSVYDDNVGPTRSRLFTEASSTECAGWATSSESLTTSQFDRVCWLGDINRIANHIAVHTGEEESTTTRDTMLLLLLLLLLLHVRKQTLFFPSKSSASHHIMTDVVFPAVLKFIVTSCYRIFN